MKKHHNGARILVVDDEKDMCWALNKILQLEGFGVTTAVSARAAIAAAKKKSFKVAFLDAKLPDVDGVELARQLRSLRPEIRCVLISGYLYNDDHIVQAGLEQGNICTFVSKPFLIHEVMRALQAALVKPKS